MGRGSTLRDLAYAARRPRLREGLGMAAPTITNAFAPGRRMRKHRLSGEAGKPPAFSGCSVERPSHGTGPMRGHRSRGGGRMQGRGWTVVVVGLLCRAAAGAGPAPAEPLTVIRAGTLIDGVSGSPRTNQVIVVRG